MGTTGLSIIWATSLILTVTPPSAAAANSSAATRPTGERCALDAVYHELVSRRELQISRLHKYVQNGVFPQNTDFPGHLVPYFVDKRGTACAVGQLILLDGQTELAREIAATDNHLRLENVTHGPIVAWILDSGLTQSECALIQPAYATIEDYRGGREWKTEQTRLQNHFARVEETLQVQSQRSLGEALIAKLAASPDGVASNVVALIEALRSDEPNVRIAAAHLLAKIPPESTKRELRIDALKPNLNDSVSAVRFWTAVAIEQIGPAPSYAARLSRGGVELHHLTLPIFLAAFRGSENELRLPALIQLAIVAPESIGSGQQLQIIPKIRHALVDACSDPDAAVRVLAREILASWRWQRTACESQQMRRHYLAESAELESLAAEASVLQQPFVHPTEVAEHIDKLRGIYDTPSSTVYFLPVAAHSSPPIASSAADAEFIVDKELRASIGQGVEEHTLPFWKFDPTIADPSGLYFFVTARRTDADVDYPLIYLVPRPALFANATAPLHSWFKTTHSSEPNRWPAAPPSKIVANPDAHVVLGERLRSDLAAFTIAGDLIAYFIAHNAFICIEREVQESDTTFTWSGRFARSRHYGPRFCERGKEGGWDFHRLSFICERETGRLIFAAAPIAFPLEQMPPERLTPAWTVDELKLMGWEPLETIDFFGERLLPKEYHTFVENFSATATSDSRAKMQQQSLLHFRWSQDKSLPSPGLIYALLYDRAGDRKSALQSVRSFSNDVARDPAALADVARWELSVGETESARKHAEAALKLWPNHPACTAILQQIADTQAAPK